MSYDDGWAAINLEMPARIPRTEYSAESYHWPLIEAVTGLRVDGDAPPASREAASVAFMRAWNYDVCWSTMIGSDYLRSFCTDMGHAAYADDGSDYREAGRARFTHLDDVLRFDPVHELPSYEHGDLVARFDRHYHANVARYPDAVNMTGVYITLISGLIDMLGWETLLLAAGTDLAAFGELADRYTDWMVPIFEALAQSESELVMVHDDIVWTSGPFIAPEWYRRHVFPNYRRLLDPLREAGKKITASIATRSP